MKSFKSQRIIWLIYDKLIKTVIFHLSTYTISRKFELEIAMKKVYI